MLRIQLFDITILSCSLYTSVVIAGFSNSSLPVSYNHELIKKYTAGGKIVFDNNQDHPIAIKLNCPASSTLEEMKIQLE
jgi:hypothetical protein